MTTPQWPENQIKDGKIKHWTEQSDEWHDGFIAGLMFSSANPQDHKETIDKIKKEYFSKRAAAQVGEPSTALTRDWVKKRADIRNSAIERCAQVAEDILGPSDPNTPKGYDVPAAIRQLKDEPTPTYTQAQIEAAAKALYGNHGVPPSDKAMGMAKAALTAAAQIGETPDQRAIRYGMQSGGDLWKGTIERCAQVAEAYIERIPAGTRTADAIAAAIRRLKDEP